MSEPIKTGLDAIREQFALEEEAIRPSLALPEDNILMQLQRAEDAGTIEDFGKGRLRLAGEKIVKTLKKSDRELQEQIEKLPVQERAVPWYLKNKEPEIEAGFQIDEDLRAKSKSVDIGLFQINDFYHTPEMVGGRLESLTSDQNIRYAKMLSQTGLKWDHWRAYKDGKHLEFMDVSDEDYINKYNVNPDIIESINRQFGEDAQLAKAVMFAESGGDPYAVNYNLKDAEIDPLEEATQRFMGGESLEAIFDPSQFNQLKSKYPEEIKKIESAEGDINKSIENEDPEYIIESKFLELKKTLEESVSEEVDTVKQHDELKATVEIKRKAHKGRGDEVKKMSEAITEEAEGLQSDWIAPLEQEGVFEAIELANKLIEKSRTEQLTEEEMNQFEGAQEIVSKNQKDLAGLQKRGKDYNKNLEEYNTAVDALNGLGSDILADMGMLYPHAHYEDAEGNYIAPVRWSATTEDMAEADALATIPDDDRRVVLSAFNAGTISTDEHTSLIEDLVRGAIPVGFAAAGRLVSRIPSMILKYFELDKKLRDFSPKTPNP